MKLKTILNDEDLQRKEKILLFCNEYGIVPTIRAYEISKSTLYNSKKKVKENRGDILNE